MFYNKSHDRLSETTILTIFHMFGSHQKVAVIINRVHKFTINKNAKMNQTMYETIINCIFVFMKKMVIPVNTELVN